MSDCTYEKDPYAVLGVPNDASTDSIKKAYRKLALKHHPDRQTTDKAREEAQSLFADISGAYEILTDEHMRKEWDRDVALNTNTNVSKSGGATSSSTNNNNTNKFARGFKFNPSDPYEIWKRDFEDQFGRPYPGAAKDFVSADTHIYEARTGPTQLKKVDKRNKKKLLLTTNGEKHQTGTTANKHAKGNAHNDEDEDEAVDTGSAASDTTDAEPKKKKGFFQRWFGRKDKKEKVDETTKAKKKKAPLAITDGSDGSTNQTPDATDSATSTALVKLPGQKNQGGRDNQLTVIPDTSTALVERPLGIDNRPISMEVTVEECEDGSTKTTTTVTRPDGTVEKCVQRSGIPGKDPKKLLALEAEKKRLAIQGDNEPKLAAIEGKPTTTTRAKESEKKKKKKDTKLLENSDNQQEKKEKKKSKKKEPKLLTN
jgi:curved DNA-binding protein CbpA